MKPIDGGEEPPNESGKSKDAGMAFMMSLISIPGSLVLSFLTLMELKGDDFDSMEPNCWRIAHFFSFLFATMPVLGSSLTYILGKNHSWLKTFSYNIPLFFNCHAKVSANI